MADRQHRAWAEHRKEVAEKWFGGDEQKALNVLYALPYSTIPEWGDLDLVMSVINEDNKE